jgi:SAM-dependent methyltransferase
MIRTAENGYPLTKFSARCSCAREKPLPTLAPAPGISRCRWRRLWGGAAEFAVDVSPEMLAHLRGKREGPGLAHVQCVEGEASATGVAPGICDLVFLANVWHEFDDHRAVLDEVARLLKPGGRVAILDWRPDVEADHGPPVEHRISRAAAAGTIQEAGFAAFLERNAGRYSWLLIARR